jgi:hypothetical protein
MPLTSLLLMATYVLTPSYRFSYLYAFSFSSTWVILTYLLILNSIEKILCIELELTWPHVMVHFSMTSQAFLFVHNIFLTHVYFLDYLLMFLLNVQNAYVYSPKKCLRIFP